MRSKLAFLTIVLCLLSLMLGMAVTTFAEESESQWYIALAPGIGERSQALLGQENQPLYLNIDIAWYGKRFFFDNTDLGAFLFSGQQWSVNALAELNDERGVLNNLADVGISVGGLGGTQEMAGQGPEPPPIGGDNNDSDGGAGLDEPLAPSDAEDQPDFVETPVASPTPSPAPSPIFSPSPTSSYSLPDREQSILAGGEFLFELGSDSAYLGDMYLAALTDVSGRHNGHKMKLAYSYSVLWQRWHLQPAIEWNWLDDKLANYYFGVSENDSPNAQAIYEPGASINTEYSLLLNYAISPRLFWGLSYRYKLLDTSIVDSPIVEDDAISTFFTGIKYKFY
ncbi:MipA/OmpV family protein [Agaribacterium sp. ZY112]|uniref:MipA/OmpV family protein n=1 Tax=Agaribacterium sp. ZY112 TaxID=3233574 RepID=UPI003524024B